MDLSRGIGQPSAVSLLARSQGVGDQAAALFGEPRLPFDRFDHERMRALARALDSRGHALSELFREFQGRGRHGFEVPAQD